MKAKLQRFLSTQQQTYPSALKEIQNGRKTSHWMWFIFPQLVGLGHSEMAQYYAISDLEEAEAYYAHPVLGSRLKEITSALLLASSNNATQLMGSPDDLKLHSCMTLFSHLENADPIFQKVIVKFFNAAPDPQTLALLYC